MNLDLKEYKGFEIISVTEIPDFSSKGIYLRHKKTGLEVFHLLNDDKENLCSFCFRTPPESSNGVPHIMEHSVLCGSEKYPVKDPFIHLENQSLKTFLNALTGCDKTMYPIASVVEEDYFNLCSVYADSVFFPKLNKEVFLQEACHLEKNDKGSYSIQGVVYNEMKGCYSSFDSVCSDIVQNSILPGSIYELDSGGEPSVIPDLTYEQYLDFYKEHYRPDNCLVFLYGNIPTEKQLDFFQSDFLDRIEQRQNFYPVQKITPLQKIKSSKPKDFSKINYVRKYAPSVLTPSKDEDPTVIVSWRLSESVDVEKYLEAGLVSEILTEHDGSPITKALLDSGLGTEIASSAGFDSTTKFLYTSFGLNGVKKKNVDKVYDLIVSEIQNVIENGVKQDDIDCALMDLEFSIKEIVRHSGPFSLVLMRRVLKSWIYGASPESNLLIKNAFDKIKTKIKNDKNYLTNLLREYFIDNTQCSICVITPSPKYIEEFEQKEKLQIEKLKSKISDEQLEVQNKKLRDFQTMDETDILKCLPHINARNIKYEIPQIRTDFSLLEYSEGRRVPFALNIENTNGIDYVTVAFPFDVLLPEEYNYVSPLMYMLTEVGWSGKSWNECATVVNKYSGDFGSSSLTASCSKTKNAQKIKEQFAEYNVTGRNWFNVSVKMLHEKIKPCLEFFAECISAPDFSDLKRLKILFDEFLSDYENSVSTSGHIYMASRANCMMNLSKAADEMTGGLENLFFLRKIKNNMKLLSRKLTEISKKIFSSGAVIHLVCSENSKDESIEQIKHLANSLSLKIPEKKQPQSVENKIFSNVSLYKNNTNLEIFEKDIQVGFSACSFKCSPYGTREAVAESVFAHWISNSLLWEKVRTVCGAYGANAGLDTIELIFSVLTYRDPNPYKSLAVIEECLKLSSEKVFTEDEVQKAITGRFSSELRPRTPKANACIGFERILYCISQDDVNERIKTILSITPTDIHLAAKRMYENFIADSRKAVLSPKSCKLTSKIRKIEL